MKLQKLFGGLAFLSMGAGFMVQWMMLPPDTKRCCAGQMFIPELGDHGVYVRYGFGMAWRASIIIAAVSLAIAAVMEIADRAKRRRGSTEG